MARRLTGRCGRGVTCTTGVPPWQGWVGKCALERLSNRPRRTTDSLPSGNLPTVSRRSSGERQLRHATRAGRGRWLPCGRRRPATPVVGGALGTAFARLAGPPPLLKPAVNVRASCETDLTRDHPIHVVTAWVGNTLKVAIGRSLQTLDRDFEKAVRGRLPDGARAVQTSAERGGPELIAECLDGTNAGVFRSDPSRSAWIGELCPGGLEPSTSRVEIACRVVALSLRFSFFG